LMYLFYHRYDFQKNFYHSILYLQVSLNQALILYIKSTERKLSKRAENKSIINDVRYKYYCHFHWCNLSLDSLSSGFFKSGIDPISPVIKART
jgi:hypothetical protein